jgi:Peptidase A4 family
MSSQAVSSQAVSSTAGASPVATVAATRRLAPDQIAPNGPRSGNSISKSTNWAGYAVTGTPVTSITGSWVEPSVTCPGTKVEQAAFWVGIDGFAASDPTVQQIGTDSDCTKKVKKVLGGPSYYAWFEMYPSALVVLPSATYPVSPGDVISASVTSSGSSYVLAMSDSGRWSYSTTQVPATAPPLNASAEWITEAPTLCTKSACKVVSLADFGSVPFSGATVNGLAIDAAGLSDNQITMTKTLTSKKDKASTSALGPSGESFTVTWVHI